MTTKLSVNRYRTRPPEPRTPLPRPVPAPDPGFDMPFAPDANDDGFGTEKFATARGADPGPSGTEVDGIRREGLTGRQLRLARRLAQKHGLPATSDFDAVRLLRKAGIDPMQ